MAEPQINRAPLDVDFLQRVTISYPWDETAPTFTPTDWHGNLNGRPDERVQTIRIVYRWSDDGVWVGHIDRIYGARIKKDGTPYNERMDLNWKRNFSKEERQELVDKYRPTSTITWQEVE